MLFSLFFVVRIDEKIRVYLTIIIQITLMDLAFVVLARFRKYNYVRGGEYNYLKESTPVVSRVA